VVHIQVYGVGCPRCSTLTRRAEEAARRLRLEYQLEKVTDLPRIIETGARLPALVVDGRVVAEGRLATVDEIEQMLQASAGTRPPSL
jgi:small redox-active disulfide protein 2